MLLRPSLLLIFATTLAGDRYPPVIFVPGISGTGLLTRFSTSYYQTCQSHWEAETLEDMANTTYVRSGSWYRLWLALDNFRPPASHQDCWYSIMTLIYKKPSPWHGIGSWENPDGVETITDSGIHGVDYLDYLAGYGLSPTRYFHDIIASLETELKYIREVNMTAFGYDWRLPVWQVDWKAFISSVEDLYTANSQKRVVIICHSMGCLWINYFLASYVSRPWIDEHLEAVISLNGANGGSFKAIRALLSGYSPIYFNWFNIFKIPQLISNERIRTMCRTFPSLFSLLPNAELYGSDLPVAVVNTTKGSVVYDLGNWTEALGDEALTVQIKRVQWFVASVALKDPGLPYYCLFSYQGTRSTEYKYLYADENLRTDPEMYNTWGDGTIPMSSLTYCRKWGSTKMTRAFKGLDHMFILRDPSVAVTIRDILLAIGE